tara:strand:+ start:409 stop:1623 length:1215 start_codon:yes stop_codon:yes gene_type:complete
VLNDFLVLNLLNMAKIYYNRQYIDSKDKIVVLKALDEDLITGGKYVHNFEKKLKKVLKVKFAKSCINGTAALHMAYEAIDLKKNDVVIMPVINFVAAYSMASLYKAKIYFADVDYLTGQMTPETLINCIKKNKLKKIKAIITMYMGGYPENANKFFHLKKKYNFLIIEDACHAFGARYNHAKNMQIGSCKYSDVCAFSFHPVKSITTGEGGLLTTNNKFYFNKIKKFGAHNIVRKNKYWDYDIGRLGFNYRLSDINCALGISQLKKLSFFIKKRKEIFKIYKKNFKNITSILTVPKYQTFDKASYHLFIIRINFKYLKSKKNDLIKYLNKKNIFPQFHYKPLSEFNFLKNKIKLKDFSGAYNYYLNNISLPIYVNMKKSEVLKIIKYLRIFIKKRLPSSRINNI